MLPPRTRSQARLVWVPQKWTLLNPRCLKGNGHPHAGGEGYTPRLASGAAGACDLGTPLTQSTHVGRTRMLKTAAKRARARLRGPTPRHQQAAARAVARKGRGGTWAPPGGATPARRGRAPGTARPPGSQRTARTRTRRRSRQPPPTHGRRGRCGRSRARRSSPSPAQRSADVLSMKWITLRPASSAGRERYGATAPTSSTCPICCLLRSSTRISAGATGAAPCRKV